MLQWPPRDDRVVLAVAPVCGSVCKIISQLEERESLADDIREMN